MKGSVIPVFGMELVTTAMFRITWIIMCASAPDHEQNSVAAAVSTECGFANGAAERNVQKEAFG